MLTRASSRLLRAVMTVCVCTMLNAARGMIRLCVRDVNEECLRE